MLSFTQITIFTVVLFAFLNLIHVEADIAAFTVHNKTQNFEHLPALFGADLHFKDDGLNVGGFLMVAQPEDVCKSIDPPPSNGYVLLVEKPSDCDFDLLVHNAQKARYEAAIVHNVDSNELIRMTYSWRVMLWRMVPNELKSRDLLDRLTINIPAVFVSEDTARSLTANYTHDKGGYVVLTRTIGDNTNILKECIRIGLSLLSFLIFVSGVLIGAVTLSCIVMCVTTFAQYLRQARRHKALLRKLPLHRYKTGDSAGVNECSICLSEFKNGDRLRVLSCSHAHHSKCVDPWLRMKMTCPLCTQKVEGV